VAPTVRLVNIMNKYFLVTVEEIESKLVVQTPDDSWNAESFVADALCATDLVSRGSTPQYSIRNLASPH